MSGMAHHQHLLPEMRNKTTMFAISTSIEHYIVGPGECKKAKIKKQRVYKMRAHYSQMT